MTINALDVRQLLVGGVAGYATNPNIFNVVVSYETTIEIFAINYNDEMKLYSGAVAGSFNNSMLFNATVTTTGSIKTYREAEWLMIFQGGLLGQSQDAVVSNITVQFLQEGHHA